MAKSQPKPKKEDAASTTKSARKAPRLGRGLSSLMNQPVPIHPPKESAGNASPAGETPAAEPASHTHEETDPNVGLAYIPLDQIKPNPKQPRQHINEEALISLANSIREAGLMQPIVVQKPAFHGEPYMLVAGERRWRAAKKAGLNALPALVRELSEEQIAQFALIENLQREDLNPMDKAEAFQHLHEQFNLSHDQIAQRMGLDRATISNHFRLLNLGKPVRQFIRDGLLSMGQARALAAIPDPQQQLVIASRAIRQGMSVRQLEKTIRSTNPSETESDTPAAKAIPRNAQLRDLEQQISKQIGSKVKLRSGRRKGTGTIQISFHSLEQFENLIEKLGISLEN